MGQSPKVTYRSSTTKNAYVYHTMYEIKSTLGYSYIGMTTQPLQRRLSQHKADAQSGSCSLSAKLCQKSKPKDLQAFHTKLQKNPDAFSINKLKTVTGTYHAAHKEEMRVK